MSGIIGIMRMASLSRHLLDSIQGRSQNFPVGGDDEILANWQIEMLRSDVCSVAREKFWVGIWGGLHLIWSYSPLVYIFISKRSFGLDLNP